jgi:phosphoglycolate phosphatase-like HAD superfamily hydrolase
MPIDINRVKAICFDIDGTLCETDDQFVKKLVRILTPIRFLFPGQQVHPTARKLVMFTESPGNWLYNFADRLGWDGKIVAIGDYLYQLGIGDSPEPYTLINGVRDMLAILRNRFPLSIISSRGQKSTLRFLFQYELVSCFTAIASGQTCRHTKPYPDPILWAAERMSVPPSSCLMVGDTVVDIKAGKKAGSQTLGVLCGFGNEQELKRAGADHILKDTAELIGLLGLEGYSGR